MQPSQKSKHEEKEEHAIKHERAVPLALPPTATSPTSSKHSDLTINVKNTLKEDDQVLVTSTDGPATSSPCSSSKLPGSFPQLTPIHKRGLILKATPAKSNEKRSPCSSHSPDHQFKTPTRSNGICLGDFLVKGSKSQNSKKKTPESVLGNITPSSVNQPVDHASNQSGKRKHRRRINPTKVASEDATTSAETCKLLIYL